MNIAFFLMPKNCVAFLQDDFTLRQGLEKMRHHHYTAVPVITKDGKYAGTVSEGDFLWDLVDRQTGNDNKTVIKSAEHDTVKTIIKKDRNPPVSITATMEDLLVRVMNQNFVPVVDDNGSFIGIVTRRDVIKYFYDASTAPVK